MHKIVAGVASRSYGIHVARMAGMPVSVVQRAESVLESLESHTVTSTPEPNKTTGQKSATATKNIVASPARPQLNLFD